MSATTAPMVNGFKPPGRGNVNEALEYEKILNLRDEIFAGSHPRLTLPSHALKKVSPSFPQLSSQSNASSSLALPSQTQLPGLSITSTEEEEQNKQKTSAATPFQTSIAQSGINPVLLTKSDDLIKAEIHLQRQRLEKQLREQFEQKRLDFRKKPSPAEAKPDFDVSSLLVKALELAKPEMSEGKGDESDSFDENSFYSSRAPDSIAGDAEQSPPSQENSLQDSFGANGPSVATAAAHTHNIAPTALSHPQSLRPVMQNTNASRAGLPAESTRRPSKIIDNDLDVDDEDEEGEYSPPEAMDHYPTPNNYGSQAFPDIRNRPMRRYSDLDENGKRHASPPEANVRIVRNQITSPIAPQPSRVSPLAFTKEPFALQDRRLRNGRQRGRNGSPDVSPEPPGHTRKKRKLERKAEKRARKIKEEAVSPPPFHDIQPLGSGKLPQADDRPILIDDSPSQDIRYIRAPEGYMDTPQRPMSRHAAPMMPLSEPRTSSRSAMRPIREEQDLRRVASLHNMRVEQPRDYVEYATPTRNRASSYLRVDSPVRDAPPSYAADYDRQQQQEVRVIRTPAPHYQEIYQDMEPPVRYVPEPMPPPPPRERIVVDQYGRRFREVLQDQPVMAPRAISSAYPEHEPAPYHDGYDRRRAGSLMLDERVPQRQEQDMPPPRMVRQVAEPPRTATSSTPSRREAYDPVLAGRASSVQVVDRSGRQMLYADDPGDFRPPVRMSSVRPAPQYEERPPMQVLSRSGSVRPGREGSVFVEDAHPMRREYAPSEQPRYRVVEPEPRYIDAQGREVVSVHDGGRDGGVRYVQRY